MDNPCTPEQLQELHSLIDGAIVSVDISTGDDDAGNRLFAQVESVFIANQQIVIAAVDPAPNYAQPGQEEIDLLRRFLGLSVSDYEGQAELRRDVRQLLARLQAATNRPHTRLPATGATEG